MSVPYEPVVEDQTSDEERQYERPEIYFMHRPSVRGQRWPTSIGIVQLMLGFLISFLGLMEVLIVPITENHEVTFQLNRATCYGTGLWAGLVMVLTGSTAIRAAISKRKTTVFRFYNLTVFSLLVYTGLTVFLIVAYSIGWTSPESYPPKSRMHTVHMFVTIMIVLGQLFAMAAVVQYYQVSCCNNLSLGQTWMQRVRVRQPARRGEMNAAAVDHPTIQ